MAAPRILRLLLLLEAWILLLALPCALLPTDWMAHVHSALGLGELPRRIITEYLTRSASLLYGFWGVLHLYLAADVVGLARPIKIFSAWKVAFGVGMLGVDVLVAMPWFWTLSEGPGIIAVSVAGWWLARQVEAQTVPAVR